MPKAKGYSPVPSTENDPQQKLASQVAKAAFTEVLGKSTPHFDAYSSVPSTETESDPQQTSAPDIAKAKPEQHSDDGNDLKSGELVSHNFQLLGFLMFPMSAKQDASSYLQMSSELFGLTTVICYLLTMVFRPDVFENNPLKDRYGYNNICVGFDLPPSRYVAASCWPLVTYCVFEYAKMSIVRYRFEHVHKRLLPHSRWSGLFFQVAHLCYAISCAVFSLCFVIPPTESLHGHTRPFLVYIVARYFSTLASVWECALEADIDPEKSYTMPKTHVPARCFEYMLVYAFFCFSLVLMAEGTYWHADTYPGSGPLLPWWLSMSLDWGWMVCNGVAGNYLPRPCLMIDGKVIHDHTLAALRGRFEKKPAGNPKALIKRHSQQWLQRSRSNLRESSNMAFNEKALRADQAEFISSISQRFAEAGCKAYDADAGSAKDLTCGLTVTVMKCQLVIDERISTIPQSQRHGFFKEPHTYDGFVRINVTEHGAVRFSIRLDVPESMPLVDGKEGLSSRPGYHQVDLLLAEEFKQFAFSSCHMLDHLMGLAAQPSILSVLRHPLFLLKYLLNLRRAKKNLDNTKGIIGKNYYAGLPFRLGGGAFKFGLQTKQSHKLNESEIPLTPGASLTGFEEEVTAKYAASLVAKTTNPCLMNSDPIEWDFVAQIAELTSTLDYDKGDCVWSESESPYKAMGTFSILSVPAKAGGIAGEEGEPLYFNPWNMLDAHRPLGELQHARRAAYQRHREARVAKGGVKQPDRVCPYLSSKCQ